MVAAVAIIDLGVPPNKLKFSEQPQILRKLCFKAPKVVKDHPGKKGFSLSFDKNIIRASCRKMYVSGIVQ